jgi:membrane protease YdiL (CAAX protease family)
MQLGKATGLQIAFAIVAVFLLAAPFSKYVGRQLHLTPEWFDSLARGMQLLFLALVIFVSERLNPGVISRMVKPIPPARRTETAIVTLAQVTLPFAILGALMLWVWIPGGAVAVEQSFRTDIYHAASAAKAFTAAGLVNVFLAVAMAPLIEEIAFRGLLYGTWEQTRGWVLAMLGSSAVFALLHQGMIVQFAAGILFTCLYRRTGTLLAPMIAHAAGNLCVWYWFMGRFYYPDPQLPVGDLGSWWLHFVFLVTFILLAPLYLLMCREPSFSHEDEHPVPA